MKKILTLVLVLAMVFCLTSCQYLPDSLQSMIDTVMGSIFGENPTCEHDWMDATCILPKTCSVCGATDGDAIGHTEEIVAGTPATCTESGMTEGKKCSVCGEITVQQTVIEALGHTEETITGTPATCTENGLSDGKKCTVCGDTTVAQKVIPANGHKDEDKNYVCDDCDAKLCTNHIEEVVAGKDATCTETGLTDGKKCSVCGEIIVKQNEISAKGHADADKDHACDNECDVYQGTHEDSDKNHKCDYGCSVAIGECQDEDKDHTCDYGCGKTFGIHEDSDKNHNCDYGCSEVIGKCEDNDSDHKCDHGCDKTFGAHEDANKDHKCDYGCSVAIGEHADSATDDDHVCDYGCGATLETCTSGSPVTENTVKADCENDGSYDEVVYCFICNKELTRTQKTILATGHTDTNKDNKCDTEGCNAILCGVDNHREETVLGKSATCTADGLTEGVRCFTCGEILVAQETIPAIGHSYESTVTTAPGCETTGVKTYTCKNDASHTYEEEIPATGHSYESSVTNPTCEGNGYTTHTCACGHSYISDTIGATGHKDADKDHVCDNKCGIYQGVHEDADKDHECDYGCSVAFGECKDGNKDHKCDYGCGKTFGTHEDADKNHKCDYGCSEPIGKCEDNNKDHACDYGCVETFGTHEDSNKDHKCDYGCAVAIGDHTDSATDDDHVCDYGCGATLETCTSGSPVTENTVEADCENDGSYEEVVYCSICNKEISRTTKVIPATGHKASADDGDCTTEVKCANAGCDHIVVAAKSHTPEADDGDVTTPVKCANAGCEQILVPAKEAITLTIPALENGTITTDKKNYAVGDTVTLTITPAVGYCQKLYINGEPLMLNWKTFTYSFEAKENAYEITGSFERGLNLEASDWNRWDDHNQAYGILTTYYPANNDSWWMSIRGDYKSLTVRVQNQLPLDTKENFMVFLRVTMENGNTYIFRVYNDKNGHIAYNRAGIQNPGDANADWSNWKNLSNLDDAVCGVGVDFKVDRTAANVLTLSVNGVVLDTYTMKGITAEDKIASIDIKHQGNQGKSLAIPFALTDACEEHAWKDATCEAPNTCSICGMTMGEKLAHTYTDYVSNNDATCMVDGTKTGKCVCGKTDTIIDEGSALGHTEEIVAGKDATCDENGLTSGKKCSACGVTIVEQEVIPANHKDDNGDYKCDACGTNLCTEHSEEIIKGKAATCTESGLTDGKKCSKCGFVMESQTIIPALTHTPEADDGDLTTPVVCANAGCGYVFVPGLPAYTVTIGEFSNGTVTADKTSYEVGETVTLTITPAGGYFQKLYINGEPLILGWKTFTYSFTATENAYEITGSFERGLNLAPSEWGRWDDHNQAHGILNTYYPNNGDSWWMDIKGEYQSVEITAKNYLPKADSMDGNGKAGYQQIIRFGLSNGKTYAFRIYNDKGTYAVSCTAVSNSVTGWGNWKNIGSVLGYSIDEAMAGDGVQFKVERTSADTMTISINGVVMFTYKMDGVTEADKVTFVGIQSNYNQGKYVEIPFKLN